MSAQGVTLAGKREELGFPQRYLVVQSGQQAHRGRLQALALRVARRVQPVALVRVGHDVRRHPPLDALHDEEGRAERARVLLQPQHLRHGQVRALPHDTHRAVLADHVVHREDRVRRRVRREPQRAGMQRGFGVLDVEEQGLAGHAVGGGHGDTGGLGTGQAGAEPGGEAAGDALRVAGAGTRSRRRRHMVNPLVAQPTYGATESKPVNPLGSCRPNEPCSKMPWPVRPSRRKRAAWSVTPYAARVCGCVRS